jgi:hypothetical protein
LDYQSLSTTAGTAYVSGASQVDLRVSSSVKAFVDTSGIQIPDGNAHNSTFNSTWFNTGSVIYTNLYVQQAVNRALTLGALDTGSALTKYPYGSINKYITTAERLYTSTSDVTPLVFERDGVDRQKQIKITTATSSTQLQLALLAQNTAGLGGYAKVALTSGDSATQSRVIITGQADTLNSGFCDVGTSVVGDVNLYRFSSDGETNYYSGFRTITDLTGVPSAFMYNQTDAPSSTYTAVRILNNNITMFSGSALTTTTNIADFNVGNCSFAVPIIFSADTAGIQNRTTTTSITAGNPMTLTGDNLTFRNYSMTFGGTTNSISSYSFSSVRVNAVYTITIFNNGSGSTTFTGTAVGSGGVRVGGAGATLNTFVIPTARYATCELKYANTGAFNMYFLNFTLM